MASDLVSSSTLGRLSTPKLAQGGTNWVSYKEKMYEALIAQPGFRKHLMGRAREPTAPEALKEDANDDATKAYNTAVDKYEDEMDEWLQKQAAIASTLTHSFPDDVHQDLLNIRPVHLLWTSLCAKFEHKSTLGMFDLLGSYSGSSAPAKKTKMFSWSLTDSLRSGTNITPPVE
uniref:Uncharacterized protein n=1 Tax=Mycena chlorophos TaxID=658473 RepID=A0ABQ0LVN2_MYCCL|nr:predicted protein [Mycena chlorophos]